MQRKLCERASFTSTVRVPVSLFESRNFSKMNRLLIVLTFLFLYYGGVKVVMSRDDTCLASSDSHTCAAETGLNGFAYICTDDNSCPHYEAPGDRFFPSLLDAQFILGKENK
ncbi:uncharacterized protein [Antedon mediterranea]|uniref:uncharacterized protein isoform X2 n=1 Tax=Antedon mediterranea TaxID=105859 RepID=UPI003AF64C20